LAHGYETDAFADAFAEVPRFYVADGHHRIEEARWRREKILRDENPRIIPARKIIISSPLEYSRPVAVLATTTASLANGRGRPDFSTSENFAVSTSTKRTA